MTAVFRLAFAGSLLALLGIGLRPTWPRRVSVDEAILVTPGADAAMVRRLADSLGGAAAVTDLNDLARGSGRVHVVGWGLDAEQWATIGARPLVVHAAPAPTGFTRASWNEEAVPGEPFVVEGRISGLPAGTRVTLTDPAGRIDSIQTEESGAFTLTAWPRGIGRQLYLLEAGPRDRPIARETLGVNVMTPPRRGVLMLGAAPSFETGALRDWLAGRGDAVAIRTALSRDRYRSEFLNRDRIALSPITDRLLAQFDVAQIDGRTLTALSAAERGALRRAVEEHGLGLLVVPDTSLLGPGAPVPDRRFFFDFELRRTGDLEERAVRPTWVGTRSAAMVAVPAEPYVLLDRFGAEALLDDGTGGVQAQVTPRGAGRVGVSLVTGSSRWLLNGQRETYGEYWSRLLAALTSATLAGRVVVETGGPWLVNQPLVIRAEGSGNRSAVVVTTPSGTRDTVFLAPDRLTPDAWRGVFWPREPGWHQVGASGAAVFVQAPSAWSGRQASARQDATAMYADTQSPTPPAARTRPAPAPIPRGWFLGLFLLCAAMLWSARRPTSIRNATGALS